MTSNVNAGKRAVFVFSSLHVMMRFCPCNDKALAGMVTFYEAIIRPCLYMILSICKYLMARLF